MWMWVAHSTHMLATYVHISRTGFAPKHIDCGRNNAFGALIVIIIIILVHIYLCHVISAPEDKRRQRAQFVLIRVTRTAWNSILLKLDIFDLYVLAKSVPFPETVAKNERKILEKSLQNTRISSAYFIRWNREIFSFFSRSNHQTISKYYHFHGELFDEIRRRIGAIHSFPFLRKPTMRKKKY